MPSRKRNYTLVGIALVTIALAGYFVGKRAAGPDPVAMAGQDDHDDHAGEDAATVAGDADRAIAYWRAPMDPTEIYDKPGKSRMGMDLVPVFEEEAIPQQGQSSARFVTIEPEVTQNMGIRTAPVERVAFSRTIRTVGKVDYDEEALHVASSRISGWIEQLHVDFVGQEVGVGDPLLEIYSPELVSTQQEYLLAFRNYKRAQTSDLASVREDAGRLLSSTRQRLEYWNIPPSLVEALETTGEVQRTVTLRSPASGVVIRKDAVQGAHIAAGHDLFEIADLSSVWVHASVYDDELPWLREGQTAVMDLSYLPGREFRGRVSYVYPYLRDKARDAHARIIFQNPDLELKPGMYVNIRLEGSPVQGALVVPLEAVIRSGARSLAFVSQGKGHYEPREIQIGEEGGENNAFVRVLAGLEEGELVVTSAQFMLDSESRMQEAIQKLLSIRSDQTSTN